MQLDYSLHLHHKNKTKSNKQQKHTIMKPELNKYHFTPRYNEFAIWQWDYVGTDGRTSSNQIKRVKTYEEAVIEVYRLNGWGTPKNIKRNF